MGTDESEDVFHLYYIYGYNHPDPLVKYQYKNRSFLEKLPYRNH
jgi:hypothetical protein